MLQAVSERLAARGHSVSVLTFDAATQRDLGASRGAGLPARELLNGVRVIRVDPSGGRWHRLFQWWLRQRGGYRSSRWLLGPDFEFHFARPSGFGLRRALHRLDADVVASVNWHFGAAHWAMKSSRRRGIPHVAVPILHIERPWAQREIYAPMLAGCAAAIALTGAEAGFLRARGARAVAVAGGGVDPQRYEQRDGAAARMRYGLGSQPIVGFVGRQDGLKGVIGLIDAMQLVWREAPLTTLLLAGPRAHRDSGVVDRLKALAPAERQRVLLIDDFADAEGPSIMAACDLLAQPSLEEAFGLVVVEAWMCERPVIAADIAASRSLIEPGVDGWLVPPGDTPALAGKILDLLAHPGQRAEFGARGRQKVLSRYTWDRVADVWEETFARVARPRGRP